MSTIVYSGSEKIRVAIVEDDHGVRSGFATLINSSSRLQCAHTFSDGESAVAAIPKLDIQVLLMDINLPGVSGIETVAKIHRLRSDLPIVMLTVYDDSDRLFKALRAGASGYMLKRTPPEKILEAIEEAAQGGAPMSRQIAAQVVQYFKPAKTAAELTPREQEVLKLLSQGDQYKEIADSLGLSINTIRTFIRRIYEKLHVSSRSHATMAYYKSLDGSNEKNR
jgi:DNA-binding NarL/FixJ family response regulator